MKKTIVGFLAAALVAPAAVFAYIDCRETVTGCTAAQLAEISSQPHLTLQDRIAALQQLVQMLVAQIAQIKAATTTPTSVCFVPTFDLYIGRDDSQTNGEVKKLQLWLKSEGYFPDAQGTGYYGEKTAEAVMKWQKAHGMDFVTLTSGVGKQTRAKMQEACKNATNATPKIKWIIENANPTITDDTDSRKYEQAISVDVTKESVTKRYSVGKALGCSDKKITKLWDGTPILGQVSCYYALSGVVFNAYERNGMIVIERHDDDASGYTSGKKTVVLEI
jgi:hypothetical protein